MPGIFSKIYSKQVCTKPDAYTMSAWEQRKAKANLGFKGNKLNEITLIRVPK